MIREANTNDIEVIYKLGSDYLINFKNTYNLEEYINNNKYIILVSEHTNVNAFLIAYKNIDFSELQFIVVDYNCRNLKIATKLMKHFINNYACNLPILLEVAVNNEYAIKLYKKFDFKIISIRKKYYKDIDAYVMKKEVL